jgi:hypothetical protein
VEKLVEIATDGFVIIPTQRTSWLNLHFVLTVSEICNRAKQ